MSSFIQVRIYDDKFWVWNQGKLPEDISLESLRVVHSSHPRNPLIADVCFKGGYIDSWGTRHAENHSTPAAKPNCPSLNH
jgi:ATP-dependent DNA helicase RecG